MTVRRKFITKAGRLPAQPCNNAKRAFRKIHYKAGKSLVYALPGAGNEIQKHGVQRRYKVFDGQLHFIQRRGHIAVIDAGKKRDCILQKYYKARAQHNQQRSGQNVKYGKAACGHEPAGALGGFREVVDQRLQKKGDAKTNYKWGQGRKKVFGTDIYQPGNDAPV